ncbi:MAG: divalent-cation tolerance protein CutA [Maricaulis sp.]|nr:divalent-cation tolerance protein CutA [Maricaulis sp.]
MRFTWIYTTWPDQAAAEAAAAPLVEERLCACANILPGMTSVYRWQGRVETAQECVMILKTRADRATALRERLLALHPYDTPCILALPVDDAASGPAFLDWIAEQTGALPD